MKILIVAQDPAIGKSIENTLRRAGHQPTIATDGEIALAALSRDEFRMVIPDSKLAEVHGLELCSAIRQQVRDPHVYVILLVDHFGSREVIDGIFAGADDFLTKSSPEAELTVRVKYGQRVLSLNCRNSVAFNLARMAETRDCCLERHIERLQHYCRWLAEAMREESHLWRQLDAGFVRQLFCSCGLHDIGTFCIPTSILMKPGRLNEEEFRVVKTHPTVGADMLDSVSRYFPDEHYPRMSRDIILAHHERWDGQGYPRGLAGDNIPLAARIVKLADVYDALTSKRVYREAMSHTAARDIIVSESGKQLDPATVAAFCRVESKFMQIRWRFGFAEADSVACAV